MLGRSHKLLRLALATAVLGVTAPACDLLSPLPEGPMAGAPDAGGHTPVTPPVDPPPPPPNTPPPVPPQFGVLEQPRMGQVIKGKTASTSITFSGFHTKSGEKIDVQVLDNPLDAKSWVSIGTTTTASTATNDGTADLYAYSVDVTPGATAARWPDGGILHARVVDGDGGRLIDFYHDGDACLAAAGTSWRARAEQCGSQFQRELVLVSPGPSPADQGFFGLGGADYLDVKGFSFDQQISDYYTTIDAPLTVDDFRNRFGMNTPGSDEVQATYLNAGDLGIGREMHCATFATLAGPGVACYVANYGAFGGINGLSLAQAIQGTELGGSNGDFATVAMAYFPPITAPNSVRFYVYGMDHALLTKAQLDTHGNNTSVPNNCVNCHGGQSAYQGIGNVLTNARFLPFDLDALEFAPNGQFSRANQEDAFRALNQMVAGAQLTIGSQELIDGWYASAGGVAKTGGAYDGTFVPTGWNESPATKEVYKNAIAPYCRDCHATQQRATDRDPLDFTSAGVFLGQAGDLAADLCGTPAKGKAHRMPNAEATLRRYWGSPARAYLAAYLGMAGACAP